jgi:hypothetical protein
MIDYHVYKYVINNLMLLISHSLLPLGRDMKSSVRTVYNQG